jgi:hypothetical protein
MVDNHIDIPYPKSISCQSAAQIWGGTRHPPSPRRRARSQQLPCRATRLADIARHVIDTQHQPSFVELHGIP